MNRLIQQFEEYRLENKITQQKIADKLGVSFSTVNRWLNDRTIPSKIQEFHINKLLGKQKNSRRKSS